MKTTTTPIQRYALRALKREELLAALGYTGKTKVQPARLNGRFMSKRVAAAAALVAANAERALATAHIARLAR